MKFAIAADHAGFPLKEALKEFLLKEGYEVKDFGAYTLNPEDGFSDYAISASRAVSNGECEKGVFVCGTGIAVTITANKFKGVRAFDCTCKDFAILAREHNDTNVICFPGRFISEEDAKEYLKIWLETEFLGGKYKDRMDKLELL